MELIIFIITAIICLTLGYLIGAKNNKANQSSPINEVYNSDIRSLTENMTELKLTNGEILENSKSLVERIGGEKARVNEDNWGEILLENLLKDEKIVYEKQALIPGTRKKIDFLIHLPNNKKLVVDSKALTITESRAENFNNYVKAIRDSINTINDKGYKDNIPNAINIGLLYLPTDELYWRLQQEQSNVQVAELLQYCSSKDIYIVSPFTFIPVLSVIKAFYNEVEQYNGISNMQRFFRDANREIEEVKKAVGKMTTQINGARSNLGAVETRVEQLDYVIHKGFGYSEGDIEEEVNPIIENVKNNDKDPLFKKFDENNS